ERGRELLRARLTRRGATLSLGLCATAFTSTATAAVSADRVASVTAASVRFALRKGAGPTAAAAAQLAELAMRGAVVRQLSVALLGLGLVLLVAAAGWAF